MITRREIQDPSAGLLKLIARPRNEVTAAVRGSFLESIIFDCNRSKHLQSNFAIRSFVSVPRSIRFHLTSSVSDVNLSWLDIDQTIAKVKRLLPLIPCISFTRIGRRIPFRNRSHRRSSRVLSDVKALLTPLELLLPEFLVPLDPVTFTRNKTLARLRLHYTWPRRLRNTLAVTPQGGLTPSSSPLSLIRDKI